MARLLLVGNICEAEDGTLAGGACLATFIAADRQLEHMGRRNHPGEPSDGLKHDRGPLQLR